MECGYLTVPEDRSQSGGLTIRLHVGVFRTQSDDKAPDPVVYLAGGPGENPLELVPLTFNQRFAPFVADRDFIMFDQRGTGLSQPALDCPEHVETVLDTLDQDLSVEERLTLETKAMLACRDRLVSEGVNLAAYTSAENAADLNDLRQALGFDEWNLYGISYGTRLALTAMRDFPVGIRSVILDSSYPLQVNLYTALAPNAHRAFSVLFDGCAADPTCSAAYPELEATFFELVDHLTDTPITISITNALTGESFDELLSGTRLIGFLFQSLYSTEIIPLLPKTISDASKGDLDALAFIEGIFLANLEFISTGMQFSVQCGEEVRFTTQKEIAAAAEAYPELRDSFVSPIFTICQSWGAREADPIENERVSSDIPTLVLSGEYDPVTPPAWGQIVAEDLNNSFYFEFPGVGHGASISGECPLSVSLAFLADPNAEPDGSCIAEMTGPAFIVDEPEITLVPFDSEMFGISGVVPEGWIELAPGTYGRSALGLINITQLAIPGSVADQLLQRLTAQFALGDVPESAGNREADGLTWVLYEVEVRGLSFDIALAEEGAEKSYLILLQSTSGERDFYYAKVYLPAIDALK